MVGTEDALYLGEQTRQLVEFPVFVLAPDAKPVRVVVVHIPAADVAQTEGGMIVLELVEALPFAVVGLPGHSHIVDAGKLGIEGGVGQTLVYERPEHTQREPFAAKLAVDDFVGRIDEGEEVEDVAEGHIVGAAENGTYLIGIESRKFVEQRDGLRSVDALAVGELHHGGSVEALHDGAIVVGVFGLTHIYEDIIAAEHQETHLGGAGGGYQLIVVVVAIYHPYRVVATSQIYERSHIQRERHQHEEKYVGGVEVDVDVDEEVICPVDYCH